MQKSESDIEVGMQTKERWVSKSRGHLSNNAEKLIKKKTENFSPWVTYRLLISFKEVSMGTRLL